MPEVDMQTEPNTVPEEEKKPQTTERTQMQELRLAFLALATTAIVSMLTLMYGKNHPSIATQQRITAKAVEATLHISSAMQGFNIRLQRAIDNDQEWTNERRVQEIERILSDLEELQKQYPRMRETIELQDLFYKFREQCEEEIQKINGTFIPRKPVDAPRWTIAGSKKEDGTSMQ